MHIHICPVEITAALMAVEHGTLYLRSSWCYHVQNIKDKINERKDCTNASQDASTPQLAQTEIEEPSSDGHPFQRRGFFAIPLREAFHCELEEPVFVLTIWPADEHGYSVARNPKISDHYAATHYPVVPELRAFPPGLLEGPPDTR